MKSKLNLFLGLSVLFHLFILGGLFYASNKNKKDIDEPLATPIKTYFVPRPDSNFETPINQTTEENIPLNDIDTALENVINGVINEEEAVDTLSEIKQTAESAQQSSTKTQAEEGSLNADKAQLIINNSSAMPTTESVIGQIQALNQEKVKDLMSDYLHTRENEYLQSLTEAPQFSQEYLDKVAFKGQEVDCADSAKRALSFISQLTNGSVKCQKLPDIQSFIDRRLNKEE